MSVEQWTRLRRSDRAMPEDGIQAMLHRAPYGSLATSIDDQPFLHTSLFWYDQEQRRVYFHGAQQGRIHTNVMHNPRVCFSVAEIGRLLPADTAMGFSNEYASVILFGRARLAEEESEKRAALQGLLDKYFSHLRPGKDYRPMTAEEVGKTAVYAIEIEGWSGKQKWVDRD
jgi:nitroimidazol reductase NimA-like FMN-containing flavoprotein (pyridoxamine 5'-phosphate oxidase superfamily)